MYKNFEIRPGKSPMNKHSFRKVIEDVLNDEKFTLTVYNIYKKCDEEVSPYKLYRSMLARHLDEIKYPNNKEAKDVIANAQFKSFEELANLIPILVYIQIASNRSRFDLPTLKDFKGGIYLKEVEAGEADKRVPGFNGAAPSIVHKKWAKHYLLGVKTKKPATVDLSNQEKKI